MKENNNKISLDDKWYIITETRITNLLLDALKEYSNIIFSQFKIKLEKKPLTIEEITKFGNYLLPWYDKGNWVTSNKHLLVSEVRKSFKLFKREEKEIQIILVKDNQRILIIDGCHRAVALWQNLANLKDIRGTIFTLTSPYIKSIFAHDLIEFEKNE